MINPVQARGDIVELVATNKKHFGEPVQAPGEEFITSFARALKKAFYSVNDLQKTSEELTRQFAVRPNSVDIHDVTIAAEKARIALQFTKSIVDRITQAYRELINIR